YPTDREAQFGPILAHNRFVEAYSAVANQGAVTIDGVQVPNLLAIDPLKGAVYPPLLAGRAPTAPNEIVLATHTLELLHRRVGDTVTVQTPVGPRTIRIVGRMIMPSVGDILTNGVGDGGWVS